MTDKNTNIKITKIKREAVDYCYRMGGDNIHGKGAVTKAVNMANEYMRRWKDRTVVLNSGSGKLIVKALTSKGSYYFYFK